MNLPAPSILYEENFKPDLASLYEPTSYFWEGLVIKTKFVHIMGSSCQAFRNLLDTTYTLAILVIGGILTR